MEDIFKKYKKFKLVKNGAIIFASLFFALGINFAINTELSQYMKASVLGSQNKTEAQADVYMEKVDNKIVLKNGRNIGNLNKMNFSVLYDPDSLIILNTLKTIDNYSIIELIRSDGMINIQIFGDTPQNITSGSIIAELIFEKVNTSITNVNILNVHFEDEDNNIMHLTSSSIEI